ncbi:MAG: hypothetical protein M0Z28_12695 [Rhodospirillales bacterium]|nr:hypothetical protein [Rhodospirillales bacterium]
MLFDGGPFGRLRDRRGQLAVVLQQPEWALNPRLRCGLSVAERLAILGRGDRAAVGRGEDGRRGW